MSGNHLWSCFHCILSVASIYYSTTIHTYSSTANVIRRDVCVYNYVKFMQLLHCWRSFMLFRCFVCNAMYIDIEMHRLHQICPYVTFMRGKKRRFTNKQKLLLPIARCHSTYYSECGAEWGVPYDTPLTKIVPLNKVCGYILMGEESKNIS